MITGNIRTAIKVAYQNNYNVFGLLKSDNPNKNAQEKIQIDVITDGKTYVENDEAQPTHAGESSFKEFEGIYPVLPKNEGEFWPSYYGQVLTKKITNYIKGITSSGSDLWETEATSYKNYINSFKVEFKHRGEPYPVGDTYISYDRQQVEIIHDNITKNCLSFYLKEVDGDQDNYIYLNAYAIHFSKYYNVFDEKDIQTPMLHPLIHNAESLESYNLQIDANTKRPVINTFFAYRAFRGGRGSHLTEETLRIYIRKSEYDNSNGGIYHTQSTPNGFDNEFEGGQEVSQFATNYNRHATVHQNKDEEWNNVVPYGFSIFGLSDESSVGMYFNSRNGTDTSEASTPLPTSWRNKFNVRSGNQTRILYHGFDYGGRQYNYGGGTIPVVTLAYRGDKAGNLHILNNWFPINSLQNENGDCYETVMLKSDDKHPKYLGLMVASVLANIYVYEGQGTERLPYMRDIVHLTPNSTTYTKDIVYKASVILSEGEKNANNIITFKGVEYADYLRTVIGRVFGNTNPSETILNRNNVNINIKSCIKNVPLQIKIGYRNPETDNLNRFDNVTTIKQVDGTTTISHIDGLKPDILYQEIEDNDGETSYTPINPSFTIKYLKELTLDSDGIKLVPKWSNVTETNPYIVKAFENAGGKLQCKIWKSSASNSNYYSIVGYFNSHSAVALKDLVKDDVLIPFAKLF